MPKVSYADLITDWERLLRAAGDLVEEHPEVAPHLERLQANLERARALLNERNRLQAERQRATQELVAVRGAGNDEASHLRVRLKAVLGLRNEGLTRFNIKLRRSGSR